MSISPKRERHYEHRYAEELKKAGFFSLHLSDKFIPGIPDRFVAPNIWLEFKHIRLKETDKIPLHKLLSPAQRNMLRRLEAAGSRCYVVVFITVGNETRVRHLAATKAMDEAYNFGIRDFGFWGIPFDKIAKYAREDFGR